MSRSAGLMVLCVCLGAAAMYGGSNFRVRFEPVAPALPPQSPAPGAEPGRLPESVTGAPAPAPRHDPHVRPAAAPGDEPAPQSDIERVQESHGGQEIRWLVSSSRNVKTASNKVTVYLKTKPEIGKTANLFIDGTRVEKDKLADNGITYTAGEQQFVIDLDNKKLPASFALGVAVNTDGVPTAPTSSITLTKPTVPAVPQDLVTISTYQNSASAAEAGQFTTFSQGTAINVYGGYLRLRGRADLPGPSMRFFKLIDKVLYPIDAITPTDLPADRLAAEWDRELDIKQDALGTNLYLVVRAESGNSHAYYKLLVVYTPQAGVRPDRPTFTADPVPPAKEEKAATATEPAVYKTSSPALAKVAVNGPANAQQVLLYVGDGARPVQVKQSTGGKVDFDALTLPGDGTHAISVAGAAGRDIGPRTTLLVRVRSKGPTRPVVSAPGFGSGNSNGKETITISYIGEDLDPATVTAANFVLKFRQDAATEKVIDPIVKTPVFDAGTKQVVIEYNSRSIVPGEYTLTITNNVKDTFGNKLVGPRGLPPDTSDPYEFKLLALPNADNATSPTPGVTLTPAPVVPLAEYLKPRPPVEGFNPSDRVETRVVRLYYYRDAHRVAQLVNRSVKSYNAANVEVRRRAADRTRDDADKATDERKRLEGVAVRAAQEARAAEAELNNLQNNTNVARNQSAGARLEQIQLERDLEQARLELQRAQLTVTPQADTDTQVTIARQEVDRLTRQLAELRALTPIPLDAVRVEQELRVARDNLRLAEANALNRVNGGTDAARLRVRALEGELEKRRSIIQTGDTVERNNAARVAAAQQNVAVKREAEARTLEAWQVKELEERRLRESQFRVEVAAAKADPDTYGPPQPESEDPVLRTSISVIGEGLIQIRGPIKGLNAIRTMVNQIDAPVGQVRISVHTLQVNGERGDRMEKVIANIQRHLDHSRFLTAQSAQMLRYAVTAVAARKAAEAEAQLPPGCTQWHRDQKYLYSFFGKDFVDELIQLDSEFLKTGNKLLSFNSMDSTSLSAALFLMALAKNEVRAEILTEFLGLVQGKLPDAEWQYYAAGISDPKCCDACKDKRLYLLSNNSKFQSLLGFFNADITGTDTLSPLQREFIRLAQIFKARMITEMQLKQRVMERSLLEERVGAHYLEDLQAAFELEKAAKLELRKLQEQLSAAVAGTDLTVRALQLLLGEVVAKLNLVDDVLNGPLDSVPTDPKRPQTPKAANGNREFKDEKLLELLGAAASFLEEFYYNDANYKTFVTVTKHIETARKDKKLSDGQYKELTDGLRKLFEHIRDESGNIGRELGHIQALLQGERANPAEAVTRYRFLRDTALAFLRQKKDDQLGIRAKTERILTDANVVFDNLAGVTGKYEVAAKKARDARRPLDEKKLLDMLVDEMEDKFVEILEGTRAHTANIDNYMKSVATALDDDFNTQYYLPSFRRAREASRFWDVTLGQIETTTILTNNRAFGKVSPAATFEFDLPKRKILLTEGFQSAKALMDEYGALVNDPSFLALAKMASGNPVSMMNNSGGGLSAVRNVLPGLPSSADETVMAQAGPGRKEFGSALEGLIPDPAIYKFETGTGFEIRPVLSPDGQSVVFEFDYMYTTDVREPVRADEKHLGRVKRHFVHTDVQLGNFELREVSKYLVALKASRTGRGVQLLQDIPVAGALFRPLPSAASALQQNLIYSQATIFPTLFDLMGLRYAPAVADLDPLAERLAEFAVRNRRLDLEQRIYDGTAARVDDALRIPYGERRMDLYRPQTSISAQHPNGYTGPGLRMRDGHLIEGYDPRVVFPETRNAPSVSPEGRSKPITPNTGYGPPDLSPSGPFPPGYPLPGAVPAYPPGYPAPGAPLPGYQPVPGAPSMTPPAPLGSPRPISPNGTLPPGYPAPLPTGIPPGYPQPTPGYVPPSREMPAVQQPPVLRPAVPPGSAVRPATLPTLPSLPPAGTPGLSPLPTLQPGALRPAPTPVPSLSPLPTGR